MAPLITFDSVSLPIEGGISRHGRAHYTHTCEALAVAQMFSCAIERSVRDPELDDLMTISENIAMRVPGFHKLRSYFPCSLYLG